MAKEAGDEQGLLSLIAKHQKYEAKFEILSTTAQRLMWAMQRHHMYAILELEEQTVDKKIEEIERANSELSAWIVATFPE